MALLLMAPLLAAGCGVGRSEDLTQAQLLAKIDGRRLSAAEVDQQLRLADLLCGFDRRVLERIWVQLDARQLEFQDFVFGQRCPDQSSAYVAARPELGTVPEELRPALEIPALIGRLPVSERDRGGGAERGRDLTSTTGSDSATGDDAQGTGGGDDLTGAVTRGGTDVGSGEPSTDTGPGGG